VLQLPELWLVWANCKQPLNICGVVVGTSIVIALKRQEQNLYHAAAFAPQKKERNPIHCHTKAADI
jgi:hypothetical protein